MTVSWVYEHTRDDAEDPHAAVFLCGAYRLAGDVGRSLIQALPPMLVIRPSAHGQVHDVVYVGMVTRYTVELDAGGVLQVVEQNLETSFADVSSAKGQRVRLFWSPENVFEISSFPKEGK